MNFHRKIVDIGYKRLSFLIKGTAAPIHAAKIAGKGDRSLFARWREDSIGPQLRQARAAGFALIWAALLIYAVDGLWRARSVARAAGTSPA